VAEPPVPGSAPVSDHDHWRALTGALLSVLRTDRSTLSEATEHGGTLIGTLDHQRQRWTLTLGTLTLSSVEGTRLASLNAALPGEYPTWVAAHVTAHGKTASLQVQPRHPLLRPRRRVRPD